MLAQSSESVVIPSLGLVLTAGVPIEVTPAQAQALAGHPLITITESSSPASVAAPLTQAQPVVSVSVPSSSMPQVSAPSPSTQEV
jgi:hypothetical protein